ncbi:MAG: shikimate dehydrogenase [Pseudomonadota bacterium]
MAEVLRTGLIGAHIGRSRFARALDLLCARFGVQLEFELLDSAQTLGFDFETCVDRLRKAGWTGVTVTHPFKLRAATYLRDALCPDVAQLGASNTLLFDPLSAHNTDYSGFLVAWRARMKDAVPGRVAMAGAGGVACALGPALKTLGATEILLWDVDPARATDLADRIGLPARAIPLDQVSQAVRHADGLVNATPLGMGTDPRAAFDLSALGPQAWAFDAVYTPVWTPFLRAARASGLECLTGFELFTHMALDSFCLYTGHSVDPALAHVLAPLEPKESLDA